MSKPTIEHHWRFLTDQKTHCARFIDFFLGYHPWLIFSIINWFNVRAYSAERYINFRFLLHTSLKLDWNFLRDDNTNCTVGLITFSCSFKFKRGRREQLLLNEKNPCTLIATSCVMDYRNSEHSTKIYNDNESDFFLYKRIEWCQRLRAFFQWVFFLLHCYLRFLIWINKK